MRIMLLVIGFFGILCAGGNLSAQGLPPYQTGWPLGLPSYEAVFGTLDGMEPVAIVYGTPGCGDCITVRDAFGEPWIEWASPDSANPYNIYPPNTLMGDMDGDGIAEIVVIQNTGNQVHVFSGATGQYLLGWPQYLGIYTVPGAKYTALADLDGDGDDELIGAGFTPEGAPEIFALQDDGTNLPGWPQVMEADSPYPTWVWGIAVGDLDFDGHEEVVATLGRLSEDGNDLISAPDYVFEADGEIRPGWPAYPPYSGWMSDPRIADLNGDGSCEILGTSAWGISILSANGLPFGSVLTPNAGYKVGIGDTNGDGILDIVCGLYYQVQVFDPVQGSLLAEFDDPTLGNLAGYSLADVDGDGADEIAFYSRLGTENYVYVTDGALTPLPGFPFENSDSSSGLSANKHTYFLDFDGDGDIELAFTADAAVQVLDIPNPSGNPVRVDWSGLNGKPSGSGYFHEGRERYMVRGDANMDGSVDLADGIVTLQYLFFGAPLSCLQAADANRDDRLDLTDAIRILRLLFEPGTGPLPAPYPGCGRALESHTLSCEVSLSRYSCP